MFSSQTARKRGHQSVLRPTAGRYRTGLNLKFLPNVGHGQRFRGASGKALTEARPPPLLPVDKRRNFAVRFRQPKQHEFELLTIPVTKKKPPPPGGPTMYRRTLDLGLFFVFALTSALAAQSSSTIRPPMLGSWLYGALSSTEYYDRTTNKWQDASGASEIVTFLADGRYERTRLMSLTTYGCTSKIYFYEKGTVNVAGDKITYRPSEGVNKGYTCKPSNSWQTNKINPETWFFQFEKDSNGADIMVLRNLKGDAEAHYGRYKR